MTNRHRVTTVAATLLGAAMSVVLLQAPVQSAFYSPAFGNAVTASTTDFKPTLTALVDGNAYLSRWDSCTAGVFEDDVFYIHFQSGNAVSGAKVAAGDIRIALGTTCSGTSGLAAGQVVTSGDADFDKILINPDGATSTFALFNTYTEFLELDGLEGFTAGDGVYVDTGDLGAACAGEADGLSNCDLRLTARTISGTSFSAGTIVVTGNADLNEIGDTDGVFPEATHQLTPAGAETLWYFDANENRVLDRGSPADTAYLRFAAGAPASFVGPANHEAFVPIPLDLRLTAYSGFSHGTLTAAGNADVLPILVDAPANRLVCIPSTCLSSPSSSDKLLVTWSATGTRVRMGDLAVNTVSGQTAGTFVNSASTGAGTVFVDASVAVTTLLYFIDLSPTGLGEEDPVYLNRPASIGGTADGGNGFRISVNDIRLYVPPSLSGAGSAGTPVASGNTDLSTYGTTDGTALTTLKFFDSDRGQPMTALRAVATDSVKLSGSGGTWGAGELVYASASTAALGSAVVAGNYRVTGYSYAEDSAVACTNNENADCGDTLTTVANIRITGGNALYDAGEDAYLSADDEISDGDIRLTPTSGGGVGSVVSCAANPGECPASTGDLVAASNACLSGSDATYNAGEFAYQHPTSCPSTVSGTTLTRISPISFTAQTVVSSTDPDVGLPLVSPTAGHFKITGTDNTFTPGTDFMYVSSNHIVDSSDFRVTEITLNTATLTASPTVAILATDPDVAGSALLGTGDTLYVSATSTTNSKIPLYSDVRLAPYGSHGFGTMVAAGHTDYTPRVITIITDSTVCLMRNDRGNPGQYNDDAFYWARDCTSAPFNPSAGDARITAVSGFSSLTPGTIVLGGDGDTSVSATVGGSAAVANLRYVDGPSSKASSLFDSGDFLYLNQHVDVAADSVLGANDLRVKPASVGGNSYNAGTFVNAPDSDRSTYATAPDFKSDPDGAGALVFKLKFIDENGDGAWNPGEFYVIGVDDADCTSPNCSLLLNLGDVFVTGTGSGSSSGGSGGSTTGPAPPSLSNPQITPTCVAPSGTATASVTFTDSLNRVPTTKSLFLGSSTYTLSTTSSSHSSGAVYTSTFVVPGAPDTYTGTFSFTNAGGTVTVASPPLVVLSSAASAPTLSLGSVSPASGASGATFVWKVTYKDLNNDAPSVKKVIIDGTEFDMTSGDTSYCDGADFTYSQALSAGAHTYAFRFGDATSTVRLPAEGTLAGPTVEGGETTTPPATTSPSATPTTEVKDQPGFGVLALVAAVLAVAIGLRRRLA